MHNIVQTPPIQLATLQQWWSMHSQASLALQIKYVSQCDSTNTQLCHSPHQHNTLLVAEQQTHGRGQFERTWLSGTGDLTFSIGLRLLPEQVPALSLRIGLALAQVCATHGWQAQLKWPNDVIATHPDTGQRGKLAGILVHNQIADDGQHAWAVIGIGLNIGARLLPNQNNDAAFAPIGLAQLDERWITPREGQREELLMQIVDTVLVHIETAAPAPDEQLATTWNAHDLWFNQPMSITTSAGQSTQGIGRGVNHHGAYQLLTEQGLLHFYSGQLRPLS
ncbi:biotin--[acetyl-CoA-carboxylase] ligase [Hydromonas duriensis]|uniref:BirA family biotin operon repressor/biotin-[acetyl-CoA-carboxylase] ligase n=1 Tax=Hydromonas duriensis TaxID=1527608 RepID=A0A4R6Y4U9_9BURK|nr:biotin--[acetyl-CoA-carboxylase] ligase [Hydromonas duriensis]TDR30199.1 BirA family biotin operon repressor/biotin-[acetyl-CoA-carboxylase] ligase [Hydromonas duriensis]